MPISIVFIAVIIITIILQIKLRRSSSGFEEKKEDYIEKLQEADNTIIRGELDLPYVSPETDCLPFCEYPDKPEYKKINRKQKAVVSKSKLTMICLPENLSNIDLKLAYGANNFDKVAIFEEHFNGYHRALLEWATELIALDKKEDAKKVMEYGIKFNSNLSSVYKKLADLYAELSDVNSLKELKEYAENSQLILKDKTVKYIESLMALKN